MASPETLFNTVPEISPQTSREKQPTPPPQNALDWSTYKAQKATCREYVVKIACKDCGQPYNAPLGCHLRTCPACAKEYGDRVYREILGIAKSLPITATHRLRMITLGYGTKKTMREGAEEAGKALTKIWRSNLRPRLNPGKLPARYGRAGVFASIEFGAKNNSVHIHALYYGPWIDREKLQKRWKKLTGSWYVDVRMCRGARGIREIIKYISKGITGNDYKAYEIEKALTGTRRVITYGEFYNRKAKLNEEVYQFTCPCCGSAQWEFTGIIKKDKMIDQEIYHFHRLRRASLGGPVTEIWENQNEGVRA